MEYLAFKVALGRQASGSTVPGLVAWLPNFSVVTLFVAEPTPPPKSASASLFSPGNVTGFSRLEMSLKD